MFLCSHFNIHSVGLLELVQCWYEWEGLVLLELHQWQCDWEGISIAGASSMTMWMGGDKYCWSFINDNVNGRGLVLLEFQKQYKKFQIFGRWGNGPVFEKIKTAFYREASWLVPQPIEEESWNFERMFTKHHVAFAICHMSHLMCHMSCDMCLI